jgi:hypothetical protein
MRSFTTTAALAAIAFSTSLTLGYAQSNDQESTFDSDPGSAVVDTSNATSSIVGDRSNGDTGKSMHESQGETDAPTPPAGTLKSPCPSGLGTGNGDCR